MTISNDPLLLFRGGGSLEIQSGGVFGVIERKNIGKKN